MMRVTPTSSYALGWARVGEVSRSSASSAGAASPPSRSRGWPESFFSDVCEEDVAYDLARGRRLTGKNDYEKIVHFLYGRGYSGDISSRVARRVLDEVTSGS